MNASSTFEAGDGDAYELVMGRWSRRLASSFLEFTSFADYWAPYDTGEGPAADYVATLGEAERSRLIEAVRASYLDGEPDGSRSYAALAWAVKGLA